MKRPLVPTLLLVAGLLAASCSSGSGSSGDGAGTQVPSQAATSDGGVPPVNPFLADSVVPIAHFDPAQTDSQAVSGPEGPTKELTADDLTYSHLGPAHFGVAISPEYPNGERVIWSNGGDRVSKLDYDTLEVVAELPLPEREQLTEAEAEADEIIESLDSLEGIELADEGFALGARFLAGLAGVYYLLDVDNTLFVGGAESIIAYQDEDPDDPASAIRVRDEWERPAEVGGNFVGANIAFDGRLVMVTDEGWLVVVERDFTDYQAIQLEGAEDAPAHNAAMAAEGHRAGTADWVRNSIAIDKNGGIYVVSFEHMHKVVWDGTELSTDPVDGAWTEPYLNGTGFGSGATPSLMGFGDDEFVVITDGEKLMNVVLYWRDGVPEDWEALDGAPSSRIAGQLPANMGDPDRTSIQSEQSVVVAGYGAMVVDNEPASIPEGFPTVGVRVLAGYAGVDDAVTPRGIQKFEWDPSQRSFREAWATREISSANSVPVVSIGSNIVYTVGARDGDWTLEGINWDDGTSAFHWVTGSNRYNSLFSGINLDEQGRVLHTTMFGILRYEPQT